MLGLSGERIGKRRKAILVRYSCPGCGRELCGFTKEKNIEIKECLRCMIQKAESRQK